MVTITAVCSSSSNCLWSPPAATRGESFRRSRQPGYLLRQSPPQQQQSLVVEELQSETPSRLQPRRLILLRHAKSCSQDPSLKDHDRPLSKDGESDVIQVSYKLQQLGWIPQLILSSDATRSRQTLKIMQEQVQAFVEAEIHFMSSFYSVAAMDGQTADHLQQAICKYARDETHTVMCMGHNRGWEEAASRFSGGYVELKTCNAALLQAAGKSWQEAFVLSGDGGWKLQQLVKP